MFSLKQSYGAPSALSSKQSTCRKAETDGLKESCNIDAELTLKIVTLNALFPPDDAGLTGSVNEERSYMLRNKTGFIYSVMQ